MNKSTKTEILPQNAHRLSLLQSLTHIKDHICEKTVLLVCFSLCCAAGGARCSPRGKVTHSDGSGQMRVYTPSVIAALQKHLASTDPELGGPLENLVQSSSQLNPSSDLSCPLLTCFFLFLHSPSSGCTSRQSVLSLGVPGPEGLHHGGGAGGLDRGPDRPGHLSCLAGYRLVHCQPEQGTESSLGRW